MDQPQPTPAELPHRFKWVGGRLCLDFVNTVGGRNHGSERPEGSAYRIRADKLGSLADLAVWERGEAALTSSPRPAASTRAASDEAPMLARVVALREALYRIFRSTIRSSAIAAPDLDTLSSELRSARSRQRLVERGGRVELTADPTEPFPAALLGRIAESALELLVHADRERLRQCPGDECGWLFLDESRSGRRRWCDMKDCGNLAKVHRFRSRLREKVYVAER